jgi:hypothetical protein
VDKAWKFYASLIGLLLGVMLVMPPLIVAWFHYLEYLHKTFP